MYLLHLPIRTDDVATGEPTGTAPSRRDGSGVRVGRCELLVQVLNARIPGLKLRADARQSGSKSSVYLLHRVHLSFLPGHDEILLQLLRE